MRTAALVAAATAMLLAAVPAFASVTAAAKTQVVTFNGARMVTTLRAAGNCWTTSIASRRSDAFRCMVANGIYDPCFRINSRTVACPTNVAGNAGVRIALTKPLPRPNLGNARDAWFMQLAGGVTCNIGTGTVLPGYPFYCTGNLVCSEPSTAANRRAIFVRCGRPKNGMSVIGVSGYLATRIFQ